VSFHWDHSECGKKCRAARREERRNNQCSMITARRSFGTALSVER
jgi:hypothetical protein